MVKAIILAGGRSSRMPGETLKQYRRVNDDKMLVNKVDFDSIDELSMPAIREGMIVEKIEGYDNPNISEETDFVAFEEKCDKQKLVGDDKDMLNLVLKTGDRIQIGDNVVIKLQSDSRAQLAIDAPKEVNIKRLPAETEEEKPKKKKVYIAGSGSGK